MINTENCDRWGVRYLSTIILEALLIFSSLASFGQGSNGTKLQMKAHKTSNAVVVDGELNEEVWSRAETISNFHQYFPNDTSLSEGKTEVYITYDDNYVYVAAICYDDRPGNYITPSLRRDYRGSANDGISVVIDTYQDNTNAFFFGINPFGVRREGLISNGGQTRNSYSLAWDNKWKGESKIQEGKWTAEMAIPFKTLRYKDGSKAWNMNFYRIDSKYNERSTWAHIPRNNQIFSLAFSGEIVWDEPLKKPGANIAVIPYISSAAATDYTEGTQDFKPAMGGDVKIGLTPALNLDLTFNPDFSQVEVDRQVTNLSRFEIFFPERRQFFLENADLFGQFGAPNSRPFFSRRIGITKDTITDTNVQQKILFGARVSGKITDNFRIGILNMQTDEVVGGQPPINYSVAVVQHKIFARSNISAIFVNKQDFGFDPAKGRDFKYNRVAGLDYNLASASNIWNGKVYYHQSIEEDQKPDSYSHGAQLSYNIRPMEIRWEHQLVGENFNAEVGFVPRTGFLRASPQVEFKFYPNSLKINRHGPEIAADFLIDNGGLKLDHEVSLGYRISLQDQSFIGITATESYTYLTGDFDPTRTDGVELLEGTDYKYYSVRMFYRGDQRPTLNFGLNGSAGEYFNGERYSIGGNLNYRFQPYGTAALDFQFNRIFMPQPYNDASLVLLGPRLDFTFSKTIFLTGLFQFNNQNENLSTNIRFQWRFRPVSDLYIVYTDNYYTTDLAAKNRSLVLKLTYWLNI